MRIAIDIQGIQSPGSRTRGIGRYSLEIVKHIIRNSKTNEIILVSNSALADLRSEFKDELENDYVSYLKWYSPCPLDFLSNNKTNLILASYLRSYFFSCLHVDIILITSFMEGFSDNCFTDLDKDLISIPIVSIFYDVIPLINPSLYFHNNPDFAKYYKLKINKLKKIDGLLTISNSSRKEAIKFLGFNSQYVYNISSACDQSLFNTDNNLESIDYAKISEYGSFLLYTGACDPRKNIKGLLEAYSMLPDKLSKYNLVLAGNLLKFEVELINNWIIEFNIIPSKIIKTGYVSDDELVYLYRKCSLYIFPSFHEGFGLPVLEAMSCGAPVIASNLTSIPEIIRIDEAMFDPRNVSSISRLIDKALTNEKFRKELLTNSIVQKKRFSWNDSSSTAVSALNEIARIRPKHYNLSSWKAISKKNSLNFKNLINKISKNNSLNRKLNDELLIHLSSCLDNMNMQIDTLARSITSDHSINSWRVEGPFDSSYSLAILNRSFAESLSNYIEDLSIKITEGLGDYEPNLEFLRNYPKIFSIINNSQIINDQVNVVSRNLYPPRVDDLDSKFNIMHSYGWEESEFPTNWVRDFNTYLQGITVMSSQVKKILIDNGIYIPIEVCGLGLDHIMNVTASLDYTIDAKAFKFLHVSSCFPRKGIDILLTAYGDEFTSNDNVSLIIKTFQNPHNEIVSILDKFRNGNQLFPDVILIQEDLSDEQLKSLYLQVNALVAPSKGEGFGLPLAEAMLLELPVITTGWGGQTDFCNNENSWMIDYSFSKAKTHFNLDNSYWAEPSISHLSSLLRCLYSSNSNELTQKTQKAKLLVDSLTWDKVTQENIKFITNKLPSDINIYSKLGWVSTWNSRCGIASYSKHLIEYLQEDVYIFSPLGEESVDEKPMQIIPSWVNHPSLDNNFDQLYQSIIANQITSLVIQFNYGLFEFTSFSKFLMKLKENNINIILFLHSTIDPIDDPSKSLIKLVESLKCCDRLLVHTIADLNRLKEIGLIDNATLFPHPILDHEPNIINTKNIKQHEKILIASYGFCLPNKGYKELIYAIQLLRKSFPNIELNIFSAIYNDTYDWVHQELKNLIEELELDEVVRLYTDYKSDQDILDSLSVHDLIVYPYQSSNESSSASVRHGLAALKPVLVTPLHIFDDVEDLVYYSNGLTPNDLSEAITNFLSNPVETIDSSKINLIKSRSFSKLSFRLSSIIKALEID